MDEPKEWRASMASTVDIVRNLSGILFAFQAELNALKAVVAEATPQFDERFTHHMEESSEALSDVRAVTLQMLEKIAAKLRNDPFWKD